MPILLNHRREGAIFKSIARYATTAWFVLSIFLLLKAQAGAVSFSLNNIETGGSSTGNSPNVAIDKDGNIHVAYTSGNKLKYGKRTGGTWTLTQVSTDNPLEISLALDGGDNPHIVYYTNTSPTRIRHLYYDGSTWNTDTMETTYSESFGRVSAAVDGAGHVHVSYYNASQKILKYGYFDGVAWSTQTVDNTGDVGSYNSLALDSTGRPGIAYNDITHAKLRYAELINGSWSLSNVENGNSAYISLAKNGNGLPRIVYNNNTVHFASYDGSTWTAGEALSDFAYSFALALDGNDRAHFVYAAPSGPAYAISYASQTGVGWSTYTAYAGVNFPYTAIALDGSGDPHILFHDILTSSATFLDGSGIGAPAPIGGNAHGHVQGPSGIDGTVTSVSSISWTWIDNASNELGYRIYVASASGSAFTLKADTATLVANSVSYLQTGLTVNTSYQAYVTAVNAGGIAFSSSVIRYTLTYASTGTAVSSVTQDTVNLDWSSNGNPEPGTSYQVQYSTDSSFGVLTTLTVSSSAAGIVGLLPNTVYYLRTRAINGDLVASSFDGPISTRTSPSLDVTAPSAVAVYSSSYTGVGGSIQLSFPAVGDDGLSGALPAGSEYLIQYSTWSPGTVSWSTASAQVVVSTQGIVPGTTVSIQVPVSPSFKTYYFRVWAHDEKPNYSVASSTRSAFAVPFTEETAYASASAAAGASTAMDAQGALHVAYADGSGGLSYLKRTGSTWSSPLSIDASGSNGQIAVSPDGVVHIVYDKASETALKYARYDGVSVTTRTIDTSALIQTVYHSLAVDAAGHVHVAYVKSGLQYALYNGTSWSLTAVPGGGSLGTYNAIALDPASRPRIISVGGYATFDGSNWSIDSSLPAYQDFSLAIDGNGNPHTSAYEVIFGGFGYMHYLKKSGGSWIDTQVDPASGGTSGAFGKYGKIALDGNSRPHIVYTDGNSHMRYAYYDGSVWTLGTMNVSGESIYYALDTVMDSAGDPHLLFNLQLGGSAVKAMNWTGAGFSPPIGGQARSLVQGPTGMSVTPQSLTSVRYNWTDNASNELGYRLYGSVSSTGPYTLLVDTNTLGANSNTYTESALTSGTTYYRYIVAMGSGGMAMSQMMTFNLTVPAAPGSFAGTALGVSSISWTWSDQAGEDGYRVIASTGGALSGDLAADTVSWIETNLSTNTSYSRQVAAFNSAGASTATAVVRYTKASIPTNASLSAVYVTSMTTTWQANGNPVALTTYTVVASTDSASPHSSGSDVSVSTVPAGTPQVLLTGATPNTTYYLFVKAVNGDGVSTAYLSAGSTTTLAAAPGALSPTGIGAAQITARWSSGSNPSWTSYQADISTDNFSSVNTSSLTLLSSATFSNLLSGTTYYFRVRALGPNVTYSNYTMLPSTQTVLYTPGAASPAFTAVATSSLTVQWTNGGNGSTARYVCDLANDSGFSSIVTSSDTATLSVTFGTGGAGSALTPNTTYFLRVNAYSGSATSASLSLGSTATYANAPSGLSLLSVSSVAISLDWAANSNPETTTNWDLWRDVSGSFSSPVQTSVSTSAASVTSLTPNTLYYFKVRVIGHNNASTSFTSTVSTNTQAAIPGSQSPSGRATTQLTANWSANTNPTGTTYQADISTDNFASVNTTSSTLNTSATFSSLLTGTTYYFRVRAVAVDGTVTNYTTLPTTTTLLQTPGSASPAFTAVATSSVTVQWISGGNGSNTRYTCDLATDSGFTSIVTSSDTAALTAKFGTGGAGSALTPNTIYFLRVNAYVGSTTSAYLSLGSTATYANAPSGLTLLLVSSSVISLDWAANSNPETTTNWDLWRDVSAAFSSPVQTSVSTSAATVAGLSSDTTYYFRVRVLGHNGVSTSYTATVSTLTWPALPSAPGGFTGNVQSATAIGWNWNTVSGATGYRVASAAGSSLSGNLSSGTTYWTETGLSTNTSYSRVVAAYNASGASTSSVVTHYTLAAAPKNLSIAAVYITSMSLTWQANGNPAGTTYQISYGLIGQSTSTVTATTTSASLTGLSQGTTYFLIVDALNGENVTALSGVTLSTVTSVSHSASGTFDPDTGQTLTLDTSYGSIELEIPPQAFPNAVGVTLDIPSSYPDATSAITGLTGTGMGVQVTLDQSVQPGVETTLRFDYSPTQALALGLDENRLLVARYDPASRLWVPLSGSVDTVNHRVTGRTRHFSLFQIMQAVPAGNLSQVKAFPNPLRPARGDTEMRFVNLPAGSRLRLYTIAGELVRDLTADATGSATWDGLNGSGKAVASGVYFVFIEGGGDRTRTRVAVQR